MDENNILKKKNNSNYRYHRNQSKNKNYSHKKEEKKNEIPIIKAYKLEPLECKEMSIEEKNNSIFLEWLKTNKLKYSIGIIVLLMSLFGVSYSYFNYTKVDSRQADIASGEVYVRVVEDAANITLNKMYPRTDEEARSRNDNYFEFTVKAKNTSSTKAVIYNININNGENVSGKTRINPKYIKLDLEKKVGNDYIDILKGVSLNDFSYTDLVDINTTNEITKKFRIRLWVGDNLIISDTETGASYTQSQFNNLFATFNISVNSEDKEVAYSIFAKNADTTTQINFANNSSVSNGEGLYRLLGTENDDFPIYYYRGAVENNNVLFGGFCWQIVRTTDTGGIKMIYNGLPDITGSGDNITYNCGNTREFQDDVLSTQNLNESTGYFYADDFEIVSREGNGVTYRLKAGANGIQQIAITSSNAASTIPTIASDYPYTCLNNTDGDATCTKLVKVDSYANGTSANVYASTNLVTIGQSSFNSNYTGVSDVGYMSNIGYAIQTSDPASGSYFGKSIEYGKYDSNNPGTNVYRLKDEGTGTIGDSLTADRHYSCNATTSTGTCTTVRYYFYNDDTTYKYINLTNGETVEDALYKMTGTGSAAVKLRNEGYTLNQTDSTVKGVIDTWFRTNLTNEVNTGNQNYSKYIEDTIFCNDRSYKTTARNTGFPIYSESGWNPNGGSLNKFLYFGTFNRFNNSWYSVDNVPTIKNTGNNVINQACPNETDRFSMKSSVAHLNYPVGLLSVDEIIIVGEGGNGANNSSYFLYTGESYWSLSPRHINYSSAYEFSVSNVGNLSYNYVRNALGIRPVISIKLGTEFEKGGDGTPTNPYVVKYD